MRSQSEPLTERLEVGMSNSLENGVAVAVVALVVLLSPGSARAELTFNARLCTAADPCNVGFGPHGTGSPPSLTNQDFIDFFNSTGDFNFPPDSTFAFGITAVSADGTAIGEVCCGPISAFDTQFIFESGGLTCCVLDTPYVLNDINNHDLIVGGEGGLGFDGPLG